MIANNFHRRTDLTPNICAVYVEPRARGRGVARACAELSAAGWERACLITGRDCFYGHSGWKFYGMAEENDGGWIQMGVRRLNEEEK